MSQAHDHGADAGHGDHGHGSPFIQHHYDDGQHQFDSGKLGIWFFLAQEVLFFSGLFVCYVLYRTHHPEIFAYAHHYLDVKWGAINTGVLIASSLSAAWAVRCAQLNQKRGLILCIVITLACAFGFLGIKYVEYMHKIHEGMLFGEQFDPCVTPNETPLITKTKKCHGTKSSVVWDVNAKQPVSGCLDLKGANGYDRDPVTPGIQAQCKVDEVKFNLAARPPVEAGRRAIEACEMEKEAGGETKPKHYPCWILQYNANVCVKGPAALVLYGDEALRGNEVAIAATCEPALKPLGAPDPFADKTKVMSLGERSADPVKQLSKHELIEELESQPPPPKTNMFFSIYFAMTGLHGIHVLGGIVLFAWLLIRAIKGHFDSEYFGPIDYAALYWHLVDLIWIFLFPLLYLIH